MSREWTVVDLFSGAGGMSFGFHTHPRFRILAAVDAEFGKPSSGEGSLECNKTYAANMGIEPLSLNLAEVTARELRGAVKLPTTEPLDVLISCAPCTGFSRTNANNHLTDDPRNSLVNKSGEFVEELRPRIFLMENARELIQGRNSHHFEQLRQRLIRLGYQVRGDIHFLHEFGLPQRRERALVVAVAEGLRLRTLADLWDGMTLVPAAVTVRRAIATLPAVEAGSAYAGDPLHVSPRMNELNLSRLRAIPKDGGSWLDLNRTARTRHLLTHAMLRYIAAGDFGSHPDVYGRLAWDKPAVTIKRECGHIGNGRYSHPEQDRLCTIREMSILQGFPKQYRFESKSMTNNYRHIGDAVPPLISFQLACVCEWILGGSRRDPQDLLLPGTHLAASDLVEVGGRQLSLSFQP